MRYTPKDKLPTIDISAEAAEEPTSTPQWLWMVFILVVGLGTIGYMFHTVASRAPLPPSAAERQAWEESAALSAAQAAVKDQLKAPATVVFSPPDETLITGYEGSYRISGWVDAQNSFGALLRNRYVAEATFDNASGRWRVDATVTTPQ